MSCTAMSYPVKQIYSTGILENRKLDDPPFPDTRKEEEGKKKKS